MVAGINAVTAATSLQALRSSPVGWAASLRLVRHCIVFGRESICCVLFRWNAVRLIGYQPRTNTITMKCRILLSSCLFGVLISNPLPADDWPMWRRDSGRTAVTQSELPESLKLKWVRHLPPVTPAYHSERLQFDAGYEPIVASGRLLIGSSKNDSVTAYDVQTGAEIWVVRTNGPVRLAPAVWENSVCFGSDDGCLYCVDLETGDLRWKHRAVPSRRQLLGNKRLISVWPVRGGPVVADGRVYFAAGVWPFEGVFVYALDIESGDVVWRNDRLGYLFGQQPHNTEAIGGLAPQGYLIVNGDQLVVPCSTAYPATLNRETGELVEFELPGAGRYPGGWFAALDDTSARAVRRGQLTFDDVVNQQLHEDKIHKGQGVTGISRRIQSGERTLNFDDDLDGVQGDVHSMIVADDSLFVATRQGVIYCFADSKAVGEQQATQWRSEPGPLDVPVSVKGAASKMLQTAEHHGYAVVAGIKDGSLVKSLVRQSHLHVIAIDDDAGVVRRFRTELQRAGVYGDRVAVIEADPTVVELPPYLAALISTETPDRMRDSCERLLQTLRPFGGLAAFPGSAGDWKLDRRRVAALEPGTFELSKVDGHTSVRRVGPLPGATDYNADWQSSADDLVRFPLGVLWFDDTLAHFKRSPQPRFMGGVMVSRPKDWHAPRVKGVYSTDYPLLPAVLSDIYTGRVLDAAEHSELRAGLLKTDPAKREPSQYRPPRQKNAWKPDQPVAGERINPLTGKTEPRTFPKTYGCDGGVDYGAFYTLRAGTPAFYDKTAESGTVFLSGPRSGCTNSIIPSGGLLNVPYFYEGCTCSYPLPTAMSLVAMPESHEQWSSWGATEIQPKSIQRIGLNFGAPGDRITRDKTLWLDFPSVGGPSPNVNVKTTAVGLNSRYRHSLWMNDDVNSPWVSASSVEGLQQLTLHDLKPGRYTVNLFFAEPDDGSPGDRVQSISVQGRVVLADLDVLEESGGAMRSVVRSVEDVVVEDVFTLSLSASQGMTLISGIELVRNR